MLMIALGLADPRNLSASCEFQRQEILPAKYGRWPSGGDDSEDISSLTARCEGDPFLFPKDSCVLSDPHEPRFLLMDRGWDT